MVTSGNSNELIINTKLDVDYADAQKQLDELEKMIDEVSGEREIKIKLLSELETGDFDLGDLTQDIEDLTQSINDLNEQAKELIQKMTEAARKEVEDPRSSIEKKIQNLKKNRTNLSQGESVPLESGGVHSGNLRETSGRGGGGIWNSIKGGANRMVNAGRGLVGRITGAFRNGMSRMMGSVKQFSQPVKSLEGSIMSLIKRAAALAGLTAIVGKFVGYLKQVLNKNQEFRQAMADLKGALYTLAQPLIEFIIPVVIKMVQVLTVLVRTLAALAAKAFGKSLEEMAQNAEDTYNRLKDIQKTVAGYDELNVINNNDDEIEPDFSHVTEGILDITDPFVLGKLLADRINEALAGIDWEGIGRTIGEGLDFAIKFAYSLLKNIDFKAIGTYLAQMLNGCLDEVDTEYLGRLIVRWFTIIPDMIIGFIEGLDFGLVGRKLSDFVIGALDEFNEWFDQYDWGAMSQNFFKKVQDFIDNIDFESIYQKLATALGNLGTLIGTVVSTVIDSIGMLLNAIDFQAVGASLASFVNNLISSVDWGGIASTIVTAMTSIVDAVIGFVKALDTAEIGQSIFDVLHGIMSTLTDWLQNTDFADLAKTLLQKVWDLLANIDWAQLFTDLFQLIGATLRAVWDTMAGIATFLWDNILKPAWDSIVQFWDEKIKGKSFTEIVDNILNAILDGFGDIVMWVWNNVLAPLIAGFTGANVDDVRAAGEGIIKKFLQGIKDFFNDPLLWVWDNILAPIVAALTGSDVEDVREAGEGVIQQFLQGVKDFFNNPVKWVWENILAPMVAALTGKDVEEVKAAGNNVIEGFFQGIIDTVKDIGAWIKEHIVDPFVNWFKKLFGIASPSTVMEEQGDFVGQGILNGIAAPFKKIGDWLSEHIFEPIKKWFSEHSLGDIFTGIWDGITDAAEAVFGKDENSGLRGVFNSAKKGIAKIWTGSEDGSGDGGVKGFLVKAWDGIGSLAEKAIGKDGNSGLGLAFKTCKEGLATIWTGKSDGTGTGGVKGFIIKAWDGLGDLAEKAIGKDGSTGLGKAFKLCKEGLATIWTGSSDGTGTGGVKGFIVNAWDGLSDLAEKALGKDGSSGLGKVFKTCKEGLATIWTGSADGTGDGGIKGALSKAWDGITDAAEKALGKDGSSGLGKVFKTCKEGINTLWTGKSDGTGTEGVRAGIRNAWNNITTVAQNAIGKDGTTGLGKVFSTCKSAINTLWTGKSDGTGTGGLRTGIKNAWNNISTVAQNAIGKDGSSGLGKVFNTAKGAISSLWTGKSDGTGTTGLKGIINGIFGGMKGKAEEGLGANNDHGLRYKFRTAKDGIARLWTGKADGTGTSGLKGIINGIFGGMKGKAEEGLGANNDHGLRYKFRVAKEGIAKLWTGKSDGTGTTGLKGVLNGIFGGMKGSAEAGLGANNEHGLRYKFSVAKNAITNMWQGSNGNGGLKGVLNGIFGGMKTQAGNELGSTDATGLKGKFLAAKNTLTNWWQGSNGNGGLKGTLAGIWSSMTTTAGNQLGSSGSPNTLLGKLWSFKNTITSWFTGSGGIQDTINSVWNSIVFGLKLALRGLLRLINGAITGVNTILTPLRAVIYGFGKILGADWTLDTVAIPLINVDQAVPLAAGTVVPPNRKFLAMLGDNTKEPEVVSPLSTMREAVREELKAMGMASKDPIILQVNGKTLAELVWDEQDKRYKQYGSYAPSISRA